jgi:predicted nucleic acid-binding protein
MKKILFNASVILAGLHSPSGGSAKVLKFVKSRKIKGVISEIILDETIRHSDRVNLSPKEVSEFCQKTFFEILPAPKAQTVQKYNKIVIDEGDSHVLASAEEGRINFLVTLDKKHLLILKGKVKNLRIVTPGELILLVANGD